jgi:hypothetical protein
MVTIAREGDRNGWVLLREIEMATERERRCWDVLISFEVFAFFFKCLGVNSWMDGKKLLLYAVTG